MQEGPENLNDAELLALILGRGIRGFSAMDVAHSLLAQFQNLRRLATRSPAELRGIRGVGDVKAAALLAALELGRRLSSRTLQPGASFTCSRDLYGHFGPTLRDRKREVFLAVLLDGKNRVLREVRISEGSLTASLVHPGKCLILRSENLPFRWRSYTITPPATHHPLGRTSKSLADWSIPAKLSEFASWITSFSERDSISPLRTRVSFVVLKPRPDEDPPPGYVDPI